MKILTFVCIFIVLVFIVSSCKNVAAKTKVDKYIEAQVERQNKAVSYARLRKLDFSPFKLALEKFERYEEVAKILKKTRNIMDIHECYDSKKVTCEEVVLYFLRRIQKSTTNAILELNPDVLAQARFIDENKKLPRDLLHGIPVLLKDNIGVQGKMHTTAGAAVLKDAHCDRDAILVKNIKACGAIILGKTNLSEWANFMTYPSANGFSALGGQTRNPYGNFDVGGSSAGSASAIAEFLAPLSIGTETSGSIIYPASQNSVFALKPSLGIINQDRIIPITSKQDTAGPMATNTTDLYLLFLAMQEQKNKVRKLDKDFLKGKKIGVVCGKQYERNFRAEDSLFQKKMFDDLKKAGAAVKKVYLRNRALQNVDAYAIMRYDFPRELSIYMQQANLKKVHSLKDIITLNEKYQKAYAPFGQLIFYDCYKSNLNEETYNKTWKNNHEITKKAIDELMNENDIDMLATLSNYFTSVYAPCGYPAISIPLGYRSSGEPLGMTLVGFENRDFDLINAAYSYERMHNIRQNRSY